MSDNKCDCAGRPMGTQRCAKCRMTDTPRTDAAVITGFLNVGRYQEVVPIDRARQIERELAEVKEELKWKQHRVESLQRVCRKKISETNEARDALAEALIALMADLQSEPAYSKACKALAAVKGEQP